MREKNTYPLEDPPLYGNSNYRETGGMVVFSSPDIFLSMAKKITVDEETIESVDIFVRHIREGKKKLDPPLLWIREGKVIRHDGRHRALAAKELGIDSLPVLVLDVDFEPVTREQCRHLVGEQSEQVISLLSV